MAEAAPNPRTDALATRWCSSTSTPSSSPRLPILARVRTLSFLYVISFSLPLKFDLFLTRCETLNSSYFSLFHLIFRLVFCNCRIWKMYLIVTVWDPRIWGTRFEIRVFCDLFLGRREICPCFWKFGPWLSSLCLEHCETGFFFSFSFNWMWQWAPSNCSMGFCLLRNNLHTPSFILLSC